MLSTESCISNALWWPCWRPKCVSNPMRVEKVWTFWDAYKSWTWCSNVIQTKTKLFWWTSINYILLIHQSWIIVWKKVLMSLDQVSGWKISPFAVYGKVYGRNREWNPKPIWLRMHWLGDFHWIGPERPLYLHAQKFSRIAYSCPSFDEMKSFRHLVLRGILVCSSNVPLFFRHWAH